ncbi:MAG: hypothetical protein AAF433_20785, partial [Bacteroidota bacterium]
ELFAAGDKHSASERAGRWPNPSDPTERKLVLRLKHFCQLVAATRRTNFSPQAISIQPARGQVAGPILPTQRRGSWASD